MLSYQHEYHAGNHADVLKHAVLAAIIRSLQRKPTPIRVIDTHAGSGTYDLGSALTQRHREFETGAALVFAARDAPACFMPYLEVLRALNPGGELTRYPGSPQLALKLLRSEDQLELFELHPQGLAALRACCAQERRAHIHERDAFEGLVAVVPPQERRGVVLIDPSYEEKDEFQRVVNVLAAAHRRWSNGIYLVWYPLISRAGSERLLAALWGLALPRCFRVELEPAPESRGLRGSGLVIVNLPYQLDAELAVLLPWLDSKLSRSARSRSSADWL